MHFIIVGEKDMWLYPVKKRTLFQTCSTLFLFVLLFWSLPEVSSAQQSSGTDLNVVESIDFRVETGVGIVTIDTKTPVDYEVVPDGQSRLSLRLKGVVPSQEFQVSRSLTDQSSPVQFISSFEDPLKQDSLMIIIEYKQDYKGYVEHELVQSADKLTAYLKKTDLNIVESIVFNARDGVGIITIDTESAVDYEQVAGKDGRLSLRLKGVIFSQNFQLPDDVSREDSPVRFISSFKDSDRTDDLLVVIEYKPDYKEYVEHELVQSADRLTVYLKKTDLNIVESINFNARDGVGIVTIDTESAVDYEQVAGKGGRLSLRLKGVASAQRHQLAEDVSRKDSPVRFISSFKDSDRTDDLLVVIEYKPDYKEYVEHELVQSADKLTVYLKQTDLNIVESIAFKASDGIGVVTIDTRSEVNYEQMLDKKGRVFLRLTDVALPKELSVSRDVTEYNSPVQYISSFNDPEKKNDVLVIVEFKKDKDVTYDLVKSVDRLTINFEQSVLDEEEAAVSTYSADSAHHLWAFDFRYAAAPGEPKKYKGDLISIDFKNADVRDVVTNLADIGGFNIVIARSVRGEATIRLSEVPWDQALEIIFEDAGLGGIVEDNILKVAPLGELRTRQANLRKDNQLKEELEPLITKQVFISYAKAEDLQTLADPLMTGRGSMKIDVRTNSILVTDIPSRVEEISALLNSLDTRTPQVLIESRIVQATLQFSRQLGVQWGLNYTASADTGNPTGAVFPSSVAFGGVSRASGFGSTGDAFIVDLPAATGAGAGATFGIVLGSITGAYDLDLRLSALENSGQGRVLSSPRVITLNNNTARIEQGVSVPFLSVSAAGTQTQFVDATLRLEVTPQVTNDDRVLMNIKVTDNAPDDSFGGAGGQPGIRRNEAETQVLAGDGETIVIGGIFTKTVTDSVASVPWFSRIPLIGWLFQSTSAREERREMLVFITPRIIR